MPAFKIIIPFLAHTFTPRLAIPALLVVLSALLVCHITRCNRQAFTTLQKVYDERNEMQVRQSQLLLQYGTLTSPVRVIRIAHKQYGMHLPGAREIIPVAP